MTETDPNNIDTGSPFTGDWQRLWFSLTRRAWTSLAIVPNEPDIDATGIANGLNGVGHRHGARPVQIVSAIGTRLEDVERLIQLIRSMTDDGDLVLVPVDPLVSNPASIHIIRAVSGAILVAKLRDSHLSTARKTVQAIGVERVFGSVVLG